MGERLPWQQSELGQRGHAIECRVYAEDPASGFLPQAGTLSLYREPSAPGIRIDSGIEEGAQVPVQYDPLLAKLVACGESRDVARKRASAALRSFAVLGVRTNLPFLVKLLDHRVFAAGDVHTGFVDEHMNDLLEAPDADEVVGAVAAFAKSAPAALNTRAPEHRQDPWSTMNRWGR